MGPPGPCSGGGADSSGGGGDTDWGGGGSTAIGGWSTPGREHTGQPLPFFSFPFFVAQKQALVVMSVLPAKAGTDAAVDTHRAFFCIGRARTAGSGSFAWCFVWMPRQGSASPASTQAGPPSLFAFQKHVSVYLQAALGQPAQAPEHPLCARAPPTPPTSAAARTTTRHRAPPRAFPPIPRRCRPPPLPSISSSPAPP